MGNTIKSIMIRPSSSTFNSNGIQYQDLKAYILLSNSDSDPANKVDVTISVSGMAENVGGGTRTTNPDAFYASFGGYTVKIAEKSVIMGGSTPRVSIYNKLIIGTYERGSNVTISGTLACVPIVGTGRNTSVSLTIPPKKQNLIVSPWGETHRITYTVDGTKYDVLNYL